MQLILDYWLRFGINLAIISLLIALLYWHRNPSRIYAFAMIVGGSLVYVVILALIKMEIGIGLGFGIFAIFSLLRFRTVPISLRDMTYLFATITISLVNALLMQSGDWEEAAAVNIALLATTAALEYSRVMRSRSDISLAYDNLDLLHPDKRPALIDDIRERTGIAPDRVAIRSVNIKRKSARLRIWFYEEDQRP